MSDGGVAAALDALERMLAAMTDDPDPGVVAAWHASFKEAVAGAERGPQWPELVARAHELGRVMDQHANRLKAIRGVIREELLTRSKGNRALSAYKPS